MSGVNPAMRLNKYKKRHFFAPHKDAQYAPSGDERSLFSLIIYLNDNYKHSKTKFYFPKVKSRCDIKGLTIKEEIEAYGGLEDGYECITVKPKKGYAVLFTHNLLHEAILPLTRNSIERIVLRTDVLVKRKDKPLGFAVCPEEKDDYLACLNFFRQAQQCELKLDKKSDELISIGELYERSLSIRYCYPRLLEEKINKAINIEDKYQPLIDQLPSESWLHVFKFLNEQDIENLIFAYPKFQLLKIAWKAQEERSFSSDPSKEKFIPTIETQYGSRTLFRFSDAQFFSQHIHQCCRVAAVYAFFLLGHAQDSTSYTVRYNRYTQEVCEVEMEKLLTDVFYNRNCYGSLYRVERKDERNREAKIDLDYSVDRTYMINRHQSQFIGQDISRRFHLIMKSNSNEDSEMEDDDLPEEINESFIQCSQRMSALHDEEKKLIDTVDDDCFKNGMNDDILGYRKQLIKQIDQNFGTSICRIVSAKNRTIDKICLCEIGRNDDLTNLEGLIHVYNHLIFDFDTHQLEVERLSDEESNHSDCSRLLHRHARTLKRSDLEEIPISYYRVNIEKLAEKTEGFSHASCNCQYPAVKVDQFSFLDYTYLSHVQLAVVENTDHVFVLSTYDGIAAF
jgi:hypothetical protein